MLAFILAYTAAQATPILIVAGLMVLIGIVALLVSKFGSQPGDD